jgi:predicted nuclease with TOPRIM domain
VLFWQEVLGQEGSQAQDDSELNVLKERVKTLSSEKAALQEKLKQLTKAKKRLVFSICNAID